MAFIIWGTETDNKQNKSVVCSMMMSAVEKYKAKEKVWGICEGEGQRR